MSLARRSILKLLGAAPAMLPTAATAAVPLLAKAEPIAALALAAEPPTPAPEQPGSRTVGAFLGKQLHELYEQFNAEDYQRNLVRTDGIDPDLACLRSVSRAYKVARMNERHRAHFALTRRVTKLLWP